VPELRPVALVAALLACLAAAACQSHDADSNRDQQHSGFYGGVTGGAAHP
jgi:hypothetical protein